MFRNLITRRRYNDTQSRGDKKSRRRASDFGESHGQRGNRSSRPSNPAPYKGTIRRGLRTALLIALTASACSTSDPTSQGVDGDTSSAAASSPQTGGNTQPAGDDDQWVRLEDSPLSPRQESIVEWTGDAILVAGGNDSFCPPGADCAAVEPVVGFTDGALLDPATNVWHPIADAPRPIYSGSSVVLDGTLYVAPIGPPSYRPEVLLTYRPDTDSWEEVDLPTAGLGPGLTATDHGIVLYNDSNYNPIPEEWDFTPGGDWIYFPDENRWEELPRRDEPHMFDRRFLWVHESLYRFGKLADQVETENGPPLLNVSRLDRDRWVELPKGRVLESTWVSVVGDSVVFPTLGCSEQAVNDPTDRTGAEPLTNTDINTPASAKAEADTTCIPYGGVFDATTDAWLSLPNAPRTVDGPAYAGVVGPGNIVIDHIEMRYLDVTTEQWGPVPTLVADRFKASMGATTSGVTPRNSQQVSPQPQEEIDWLTAGAGPYGIALGGISWEAAPNEQWVPEVWLWAPPGAAPRALR